MDVPGTVFLIDDDPHVRDSLGLLLSLKGLSAQLFANAESFLGTYQPDQPRCVLTDLRMPGMTGLELQAALRERRLDVPVVVLTAHGDVATAALHNALRVDHERRAAATARSSSHRRMERPTEREILSLFAARHQNREIATQLGISPRTVEVHKARIMEKLECRSLADLIRMNPAAD